MASMVREFARSAVRQLRQPRWNRLLLKSNINLHLPAIHQQRRFSQFPDEGGQDQEEKKFCIDYKKNPTIEGHEPPDLPNLQPADPKLRMAKRRKFLEKKKCEEMAKEMAKEKAEENDPCASFSRASLRWGKHKIDSCLAQLSKLKPLDPDPVCLSQERTLCQKVEREPVPSRSKKAAEKRMAMKRRHFQAKKKKEAEAKAQALAKLKHASSSNSQIKKDLEITHSISGQAEEKQEATPVASAPKPQGATSADEIELKQLLKIIKERCRKKCEEFEKSRETESKRQAEEAALRNQVKMSQINKLCQEAKKLSSCKMAKLKKICEEAHLRQQRGQAELKIPSEEAKKPT